MMTLIGITGLKGSGKDTFARALYPKGFIQIRFADPLKEMLRVLLEMAGCSAPLIEMAIEGNLKEDPFLILSGRTPRYAMQTLGTEWGRKCMGEDFWINIARERIARSKNVIVTDVRFHNEAKLIHDLGGSLVRIHRPGLLPTSHPSEIDILSLPADFEVTNDSTPEILWTKAFSILTKIQERKNV